MRCEPSERQRLSASTGATGPHSIVVALHLVRAVSSCTESFLVVRIEIEDPCCAGSFQRRKQRQESCV